MRVLGVDLPRERSGDGGEEGTLLLLDPAGRIRRVERPASLPAVAAMAVELAAGEPFVLGVNVPVVVPAKPVRARPVEGVVRRHLGARMPAGGRGAKPGALPGIAGETLMAGLAAAGQPCLPYPDRDRRQPGLAETWPPLVLKALLWEGSAFSGDDEAPASREDLFRGYAPPAYRGQSGRSRTAWAEQAATLDLLLRALEPVAGGFDLDPARHELGQVAEARDVERTAGLLDATLIAGTARRYLEAPQTCLFVGDRESGYVILPADALVRRLGVGTPAPSRGQLFPAGSLRERLGPAARLRSTELLNVPGRPPRTEAVFDEAPRYEFDNRDEMLWWKHCRHLSGPNLPTEGLREMLVQLSGDDDDTAPPLKLVRSRHRTLSFRFEPAATWRHHVHTRDGRTYGFRVIRAVYETLPA